MGTVIIEKIKPHIGGIVRVAREHLLDEPTIAAVRDALEERGVLVFPRMNLNDAEQLSFTDKLGKRVNFTRNVPGSGAADDPDVLAITLDKKINFQPEYVLGTFFWHIDGVTVNQPLPKATLLTARKLASVGGQDLSRWRGLAEVMVHPLVWTHESGRKSLVIGTHADGIVDWPVPHARSLLVRLQEWAAQPAFSYRHEWQQGDLVIWDNCGCMHRVVPYDENSGRRMHRTTIMGEERVSDSMPYRSMTAVA